MTVTVCLHEHKVCIKAKWAKSTGDVHIVGGRIVSSYNADVDLWYCRDGKHWVYKDWGMDRYIQVAEGSELDAQLRQEFE